jgi:GGDEF domain-containing protein
VAPTAYYLLRDGGIDRWGHAAGDAVLVQFAQAVEGLTWTGLEPSLRVTVSVGVAALSPPLTLGEPLAEADRALHRAKAKGRNRVALAG